MDSPGRDRSTITAGQGATLANGMTATVLDAPAAPRALTTRFLDFWLLGGASIVVWMVMIGLQGFRASWAVDQHFANLAVTTASLALIVNYPHFLMSYKLA